MEFLGIGIPELLMILVLALIVVGPERLPQVMVQVARFIREFREYASGVSQEFTTALEELQEEFRDVEEATTASMQALSDQINASVEEDTAAPALSEPPSPAQEPIEAEERVEPTPAGETPVTTTGVASLEELRRRVLRGSNGAIRSSPPPNTLEPAGRPEDSVEMRAREP